jgi:hypothetical protein
MGEKRNSCSVLMGKPEGKTPLGRLKRWWKDNIEMDLRKIGWGGMKWTLLTLDMDPRWALVNTVMNLRIHYIFGKFFSS